MKKTLGYAVPDAKSPFRRVEIDRRDPGPRDVEIAIEWCGVCHSDLHTARSEWPGTVYPCIPGHEILGRAVSVGSEVKGFAVGDRVAVGCMVDSCRTCPDCKEGLEQYCTGPATYTYNSPDRFTGKTTYGGYTARVVVDQDFVLRVSEALDPAGAAPLLCAGITTWSPLKHWEAGPGKKVGVVGLGGLGHMGVKLAHALGAHVVLFTTSPGKAEDARRLGADEVVLSRDTSQVRAHAGSFDFLLDTVAARHDLDELLGLLRRDGTLCLVGAPENPHPPVSPFNLIFKRRKLAGSLIGGIRETQEMLDFCAQHGIVADVERIPIQEIDRAYERMLKSDVRYRFSIDMSSLV